ncbi:MAG: hypothetical protein J6D47_09665 [Peptostreptococcaceae bacterium]|nr:hypothetical protein [Peptostreptococcaceae bacterium]
MMYYKKIDKDLYNINIGILNSYKIKMELLKENRESKIKNNEGDIDFLEYSLKMINLDLENINMLIDYLEKIPFKEY